MVHSFGWPFHSFYNHEIITVNNPKENKYQEYASCEYVMSINLDLIRNLKYLPTFVMGKHTKWYET
jgi:hypothetical protein